MWAYYTGMYNWVPPIEAIEFNRTANLYNATRAVLTLENVSAKMVGMYYCLKKQSYYDNRHLTLDRLVKMRQASRIYIYVNDPAHPLVPIDGIVFKVYRGDFFVSPCKPTLPNVDVELYRTNDDDDTELYESIEYYMRAGPLQVVPTKGAEHMFTMSGELIIEKANQTDTGTYCCNVKDQNGNEKYRNFQLYVHKWPEDYVMLREENNLSVIHVRRNANGITPPIDIIFEYRSYPAFITYYWLNDSDGEIMGGHNGKYELSHTDTHVKLRINEPNVFDTGIYTVFSGKSNKTLVVELTSPLRLECDVIGTPDPRIIWFKDGIPVVPENVSNHVHLNRTTLTFEFLREEDLGIYECRAENKIGRIEKNWHVEVREVEVRKLQEALRTMKQRNRTKLYNILNNPYLTMNIQKQQSGYVDYLAGQGPPDDYAPDLPDIHMI
uniref:Ig-like domain-containing protein n=1 Tax=Anopheles dirus TaxID=7168 RepID=A0A182NT46_9DIPT